MAPPDSKGQIECINITTCEMHTSGEPLRILESGGPVLPGNTLREKRQYFIENHDNLRKFIMHEPRGHRDMFGAMPVQPDLDNADAAFIFMDSHGYASMCGHAVIALGRYCVDKRVVSPVEPETVVNMQCPCGLIKVYVSYASGKSQGTRFRSIPCFAMKTGVIINIPLLNKNINVDISYGGGFYAVVSSKDVGINLDDVDFDRAISIGRAIKREASKSVKIEHPDGSHLEYIFGVIIADHSRMRADDVVRQLIIFGDGAVDRSPCGSGTSAHIALLVSKGEMDMQSKKTFQSAANNTGFIGQAIERTKCGRFDSVIVEISGRAYYTGTNSFIAEADDPIKGGFLLEG